MMLLCVCSCLRSNDRPLFSYTNTIVMFSILYRQDNEMPPNITSHHHIETFLFPANSRNYNKAHHNTRATFSFYMTAGLNCVSRVSYQKYCLKMIWLVLLIVFFICVSLCLCLFASWYYRFCLVLKCPIKFMLWYDIPFVWVKCTARVN